MMLVNFLRSDRAAAAVETVIVLPIYLLLTVGIADFGIAMFENMQVNAAAEAGAAYAAFNGGSTAYAQTEMHAAVDSAITNDPKLTVTANCCNNGEVTATASYPFAATIPYASLKNIPYISGLLPFPSSLSSTVVILVETP
jgi:Flp pilus assembly protein TadG